MSAWVDRCPKMSRIQQGLVTQALELEMLANRLEHLRQTEHAERVREAGIAAARTVVALGGSSRFPELWLSYPTLEAPHHFGVRRKLAQALGEDAPEGLLA